VNVNGLDPSDLTVLNGKVFFIGADGAGYHGLWVTDGTAAGTTEIGGGANQGVGLLYPGDLTVFNGEVLFRGQAGGFSDLWVTDGTVAGTHPLMHRKGHAGPRDQQRHQNEHAIGEL
jgi:ELWxxDGT repeat protein